MHNMLHLMYNMLHMMIVEHDVDIDAKKKHSPIEDSPIHVIVDFSNPLQEV